MAATSRSGGRCSPTCCAPSAPSKASGAYASPAPIPKGSPARDDRSHGGDARGLRAIAPAPAVGERSRAAGHAARVHGAAVHGTIGRGRAAIADLAVTTDIIVGFPGRDRGGTSRTPWRPAPRPATTAPTPSSLAASGHQGRGHGVQLRAGGCDRRAVRATQDRGRTAPPWPGIRPGSDAARRRWSRASAGATSRCWPAAPARAS